MIQVYNKYTFTTYNKIQGNKKKWFRCEQKKYWGLKKAPKMLDFSALKWENKKRNERDM